MPAECLHGRQSVERVFVCSGILAESQPQVLVGAEGYSVTPGVLIPPSMGTKTMAWAALGRGAQF